MVKHIVWFTLKDEAGGKTAAENAAKIVDMVRALDGKIPTLKHVEITTETLDTTTEPVGVVLQTMHDDAQGLHEYNVHPEHQKCVAFIKEVISSRKAIDYVV